MFQDSEEKNVVDIDIEFPTYLLKVKFKRNNFSELSEIIFSFISQYFSSGKTIFSHYISLLMK